MDISTKRTIAIIGGGRWGHVTLNELTKVTYDFEQIVLVSQYNTQSIKKLITQLQPTTNKKLIICESVDTLLQQYKQIHASIIVNAPSKHYATAIKLLDHNVPLLIEKPVVLKVTQAIHLVEKAKNKNLILMPALNYAYLEYIKNFAKHVAYFMHKIKDFTIYWSDPEGVHRFFSNIKKAKCGISFIQEVMPHLWTITNKVFAETDITLLKYDILDSRTKHIFYVKVKNIKGKFVVHEKAPKRLRKMEIMYTDETYSNILFTNEPGIITYKGNVISADLNWDKRKSPLVQEYESFLNSIEKKENKYNELLALIASTKLTEKAFEAFNNAIQYLKK